MLLETYEHLSQEQVEQIMGIADRIHELVKGLPEPQARKVQIRRKNIVCGLVA